MAEVKRVAWVTGAGTGIGRSLARALARDGWLVAASARTATDLDSLAAEVPGCITAFQLDVTSAAATAETAAQIEASLGPVSLAILNAGTYVPMTASDFSVEAVRKTFDVNLMGAVNCMAAILPGMLQRRAGHIALTGSLTAFVGLPTAAAYGATKAAINSMAEALKPDLDQHGVTMTVINPGFVRTPLTDRNRFPMPFLMDVEDATRIILRGLEHKRFAINFPWQLSAGIGLLSILPHWAKFAITRNMVPRD